MDDIWPDAVLSFWFAELDRASWFKKSDALDETIRNRFLPAYESLAGSAATLDDLLVSADTALAALIVLDQFPRNMFRGSARMFESDPKALALAKAAVDAGLDHEVPETRRAFFYLPLEHSEDLADQDRSVALFERLGDAEYLEYAEAHRRIVHRFGRFPHRNAVLGRASTDEEKAFLAEPGSSF